MALPKLISRLPRTIRSELSARRCRVSKEPVVPSQPTTPTKGGSYILPVITSEITALEHHVPQLHRIIAYRPAKSGPIDAAVLTTLGNFCLSTQADLSMIASSCRCVATGFTR